MGTPEIVDIARREAQADPLAAEFGMYILREPVVLSPLRWKRYKNSTKLNWVSVRFLKKNASQIPNNKIGIYTFVVDPGVAAHPRASILLYVGKVDNVNRSLRARFKEYFVEADDPKGRVAVVEMIKRWPAHLWFIYTEVDPPKIHQLELDLIHTFIPPINKQFKARFKRALEKNW